MSRKPRFKVQRRHDGGWPDYQGYGNKQWHQVYDNEGKLGFTLTFEEATALYWQMADGCPDQTYRIMEKR